MKDSTKGEKYTHTIKSNVQIKSNINPIAYKVKDFINEKPKQRKEPVKHDNPTMPQPQNMKPVKELTNPTSIQINNAINNMSKKSCSTFNIADIKLPPGITITKVDPTTVQPRSSKVQENSMKKVNNQVRPSSEVIVVSTGKRKEPPIPKDPVPDSQNVKKKKNKKKNNCSVISPAGKGPYPGLEIQPIKIMDSDKEQDLVNHMSVLTISPYADNKVDKIETNRKKKKKQKKSTSNIINPEEWKLLDSVFAPKDIDLDDGEMDDAERELEAFKRFCLQSIPPERKEKVHLNIKDIVLKKKSTSFNY